MAKAGTGIGVDIEMEPEAINLAALSTVALSEREKWAFEKCPESLRKQLLLLIWTMKEATLKSLQRDEIPGMKSIEIDLRGREWNPPSDFSELNFIRYSSKVLDDVQSVWAKSLTFQFPGGPSISGAIACRERGAEKIQCAAKNARQNWKMEPAPEIAALAGNSHQHIAAFTCRNLDYLAGETNSTPHTSERQDTLNSDSVGHSSGSGPGSPREN
ncbi:4'-phosphopantetheinyl transferase superfamily protein [Planctomicrobium sp. SH661]|uniref:4'-phosphopantetheinyl transferase superfamily protein n=1 Tax=Planctomicrobium sp. SH661 TaxID=3448124 RepID=UPI003F5B7B92